MAFLEWRRFTFFDVQNGADNGKIAECLQDTNVTVATSGNGQVVLCDDTGWAHLISRLWAITSFKAYEITITQAQQLPHDPYLVTIGDDEPGVNPLIKVWDLSRTDRHGNPICVRVSRAVPSHMRPMHVTALAVHENKNLLAVGFQDGSVALYRGDIARQRSGKMRTLAETGSSPITGLAFKGAEKLFVVSRVSVMLVWLSTDRCESLDPMGAAPGCSVLADKHRLTVATNKAIYCYTTEGRGPCYALEGDKVALNCFRSYLVITANEPAAKPGATTSTAPAARSHHITILDIQNKFIVFSKTFDEIDAVITEWGSFYLLTKKKELIYLNEKDLQSKLSSLFKKNLYDVAIRIASSQHYDVEGLTEIYKQYGDHLYSKGDLKGAIDQYVKTIGWLETSYVIRKYLESRHLEPLIIYLEALHKKGFATEDHTTLLLTCYVKIDQHDQQGKLKEFINTKDKTIDFDVDVAIKVVRQVSVDDALSLAAIHKRHDCYLQIVIEDKKDFKQALDYIVELEFEDADAYMKKYGHRLIQHEPEDSTKLLKLLCTDYKPRSKPLVDETSLSGGHREPDRAAPDDYIHMFLSNSAKLIEFLEHMVAHNPECSKLVYDALIEHYIHVWVKSPESEKKEYEEKVLRILRDPEANYDRDQTLIICQTLGFKPGVLYMYEENKLWRSQVSLYLREGQAEAALAVCRRRAALCPALWLDVLWHPPPAACLPELLHVIDTEKLLSRTLVVDCLASHSAYTLGDVRKYLMDILKNENEVIAREQELARKYRGEGERMKAHIQRIQREPVVFQSSRCAACTKLLELPSVHFLCQHSFHKHCFESLCESECECPSCEAPPRAPPPAPDSLHARLLAEPDPRTRSLNAPSPIQQFGPCGRIMKNSAMVMQIQDPASQRLTWYKPPLTVLVIKKVHDAQILAPFVQLVHWLVHDKSMVVFVEAAVLDDTLLAEYGDFTSVKERLMTFRASTDDLTDKIDFIICLGGDGTLLHASSLFQQSVPPVMAFHLGSLGFLTPFEFNNFQEQVMNVLEGHAALTLRSRLQCVVLRKSQDDNKDKKKPTTILVLNEVVVDRGPSPYLSNIDLFLDGKHITSVQGDGLIVSTPTGSTAYAVAAGASMIHPSVPAIMVTPICPHSLSFRPIVVPAGVELKIMPSPEARNSASVSFDGRSQLTLRPGDSLYVTTSVYPVPSICAQDQISDWFDSLAECLHWNVRKKQKQMDELSDLTHSSSDNLEELDNNHDERPSDT